MNAYVVRYIGSCREGHANMKKILKVEPVTPRSERPELKTCIKHPRPCKYDGQKCPACEAEKEFLKLTEI